MTCLGHLTLTELLAKLDRRGFWECYMGSFISASPDALLKLLERISKQLLSMFEDTFLIYTGVKTVCR